MNFLADENVHCDIIAWLRSQARDVLYAAELLSSTPDDELLAIGRSESRILITDDKDFGELVFHRRLLTHGVVLIRLETPSIVERLERLAQVWPSVEAQMPNKFIVISDRKVRVRSILPAG